MCELPTVGQNPEPVQSDTAWNAIPVRLLLLSRTKKEAWRYSDIISVLGSITCH